MDVAAGGGKGSLLLLLSLKRSTTKKAPFRGLCCFFIAIIPYLCTLASKRNVSYYFTLFKLRLFFSVMSFFF